MQLVYLKCEISKQFLTNSYDVSALYFYTFWIKYCKENCKKSNISLAKSNFTNFSQTENLKKEKSNRIWSKEEKLKVVNTYLNSDSTMKEVAAKFGLDVPIVSRWVNSFKKYGEDGLEEVKVLKKNK